MAMRTATGAYGEAVSSAWYCGLIVKVDLDEEYGQIKMECM